MVPLFNKVRIYQLIRFGVVGVFNTILDLAILNLLVYLFTVKSPIIFAICKGISFSIALINSYFMNKYFTFIKKERSTKEFYLFIMVSLIGLVINIGVSSLSFYLLGLYPHIFSVYLIATVSGLVGALFSMVVNYTSYSYFVFK